MKLQDFLVAQSKVAIFFEALLLILITGYFDYVTTWELSLSILYAFPIFMVTWYGDRRSGILLAFVCGAAWYGANANTQPYITSGGYIAAALNRLGYFVFVAIGTSAMQSLGEQSRAKIEALTRAHELEQEIVRIGEHEQMRIGRELHDGICQNLAAIDFATERLKSDLEEHALPQASTAIAIQKLVKETIVEARGLTRGIFPVQVSSDGLPAALRELVSFTNHLRQTRVTFESDDDVKIDDPVIAMHLYRITQEALSNAMRHAEASLVAIRLKCVPGQLTITIADDGRGISSNTPPQEGMGMRTMRYRAQMIGAKLAVNPQPSGGLLVGCTFPLDRPGDDN